MGQQYPHSPLRLPSWTARLIVDSVLPFALGWYGQFSVTRWSRTRSPTAADDRRFGYRSHPAAAGIPEFRHCHAVMPVAPNGNCVTALLAISGSALLITVKICIHLAVWPAKAIGSCIGVQAAGLLLGVQPKHALQ